MNEHVDLKNLDPVVVAELLVQIKDLAKALVSVLTYEDIH
jgi:hypothetical protein